MDSALLGLVGVSAAVMTAAVLYQQATKRKYTKPKTPEDSPSNTARKPKTPEDSPSKTAIYRKSVPVAQGGDQPLLTFGFA